MIKVIVFHNDFSVADRIINHLKLTFVADKPPPPRIAYQELSMATGDNRRQILDIIIDGVYDFRHQAERNLGRQCGKRRWPSVTTRRRRVHLGIR